MPTTTSIPTFRQLSHDQRSAIAVVLTTIVALILGVLVKTSVVGQLQQIKSKGVSARVPAGWLVEDGVGDLIFVSRDPFAPDVHYAVSLLSNDGNRPLADVAAERSTMIGKGLDGFRVLEETSVIRSGREGYKILYAFVSLDHPGLPLVVQGLDYYFITDGKVLVVSLKADVQVYEEAMPRFELFLDSVSYNPGG
jgi:hypothetical protein